MTTEKKQTVKLVTPLGMAKWAHVHTPHRFKSDVNYQIDVVFEKDDKQWAAWAADVMKQIRAMKVQVDQKSKKPIPHCIPIKEELDKDKKPTGRFYVTFKTGEKFPPKIFDRFGERIGPEVLIGNGSKVKVNYSPNEFDGFGGGINFYLNAVQVLDLVEYGGREAKDYDFKTEKPPEGHGQPAGDAQESGGEEQSQDTSDRIPF